MKILAIDTSTRNFSLAVCNGNKILVSKNIRLKKILSSSIIPAIEKVLKQAKIRLEKLDGFAVGRGPGSFTSLRVGLSTIKAFSMATGKPLVGIPSLDILAAALSNSSRKICVLSDAKRNLFYTCFFKKAGTYLQRKSGYLLLTMEELFKRIEKDTIFIGDGITILKKEIQSAQKGTMAPKRLWYPQARFLAELALQRFLNKEFDDPDELVPLYLYPEDCQVHKKI